ncbi:hypothetical protein [Lutibacter sp.]|uniref:hypothetical protein n=1 Tax=Lutibacter sp. TaxID=1925666 RepID=UPI0034A07433
MWFIEKYACDNYTEFIEDTYKLLGIEKINLLSQNIFAYKLAARVIAKNKVFDAWDNFLKFPAYKKITKHLETGYQQLSNERFFWITNSQENILFFKTKFKVKDIHLIKNGVEEDFLKNRTTETPVDLLNIKKPIVGFGGKISYLLNVDLINYLTLNNPDKSFVFVGQILNKQIYKSIIKRKNVFFLGDKHYDEYYKYVINFDICIVPYNISEGQHGGDSIKAYEYLSTGKKVVGTKGNGLLDLSDYLYLVNGQEEFSKELNDTKNEKSFFDVKSFTWQSKAEKILNILT